MEPTTNAKTKPDPAKPGREKTGAALVSIISNICLTLIKLVAGLWTGSVAIISEAVHSGMDLAAALMAYVSVRIADRPPDSHHPFGHGKVEYLAALFEGLLIVAAALLIIHQAVAGLLRPQPLPEMGLGAAVMLISALVNIFVSHFLFKVGRRTESAALVADAWHLRTDVYTSLGVFVALGGIIIGKRLAPELNLDFLDPLCALIVALMILKAGIKLVWKEAVTHLLDHSLSPEEIDLIQLHVQYLAPDIKGYGDIMTRRSGSCRLIYVSLRVDRSLSVEEGHKLGETLAESIREHFPNSQIYFHLDPE